MKYLQATTFCLPNVEEPFGKQLLSLLSRFGEIRSNTLYFRSSDQNFLPNLSLELACSKLPLVQFKLGEEIIQVELTNKTGQERKSPETYKPIQMSDLLNRLGSIQLTSLDHLGFNLPWFDGLHPEIAKLRKQLAPYCAYYRFPTGEEWDFILPASKLELSNASIDLSKVRRPKLEIVSFEKASTPLIQIDFLVDAPFEEIESLFPEGIAVSELKNVWVYLINPYGIDVCLVIGEEDGLDWSTFFKGHRLEG